MRLSDIKALSLNHKRRKRVGRGDGSGHGKTSGRGHKGQRSRSGSRVRATFAGGQMPLFRRLPKRGFSNARFARAWAVVNVGDLNRFEAGAEVTPEALRERRLVRRSGVGVRILGRGELNVALKVSAHHFSRTAAEKIRAAGGEVNPI